MNEHQEQMRYANIILNSITSMSIALIANFKIQEKSNIFRQAEIKMRMICHKIEDELNNNRVCRRSFLGSGVGLQRGRRGRRCAHLWRRAHWPGRASMSFRDKDVVY